jgi:flagellar motor switch protein FliM
MEVSAQFVQIAPPTDIVVTILFEVRVGEFRGAMSLCIPYLVLKPVTPKLSAQKWFVNSSRKHNARSRKVLTWQIGQAKVDCAIMLGSTRVHIRDFLKLRAGDVLRLDKKLDEDIELLVGNTPKFGGRPVLDGKNMVMHISHEIKED